MRRNETMGRRCCAVSPSELARPIAEYPRAPSELMGRGRGRLVAALAAGGLAPTAAALVLADAGASVLAEGLAPSVMAPAARLGAALLATAVLPEGLVPSAIASVLEGGEEVSVRDSPPAQGGCRPRRGQRACVGP